MTPRRSTNLAVMSPHEHRRLINELKREAATASTTLQPGAAPTPIDEKLRRRQIENDNKVKDQTLKEKTLTKLFIFLGLETTVIFGLAFFQGFGWWGFHLDDWSFRLVTSVTILQITAMLTQAVKHLFPVKK